MRHTVILGSYNRPTMVTEAIASVRAQTNPNWQLLVTDDGSEEPTLRAIRAALDGVSLVWLEAEGSVAEVVSARAAPPVATALVLHNLERPLSRHDASERAVRRINAILPFVDGEIVHYLADDDYYVSGAFAAFDELFQRPEVMVGYGRLVYVTARGVPTGAERYFPGPVHDPYCVLDHNQVAHRRTCLERVPQWDPTEIGDYASDGRFFRALTQAYGPAYGIDRLVGFKRLHGHNMQATREQTTAERE